MTRKVEKRMYAAISTTEPKFPLTTFRLLIFNHVVYSVVIVSNSGHVKNQKISFTTFQKTLLFTIIYKSSKSVWYLGKDGVWGGG